MADEPISQKRPIVTRADAMASGLKRYFTGKPCTSGHVAERIVRNCYCVDCLPELIKKDKERYRLYRRTDAFRAKNREQKRIKYQTDQEYREKYNQRRKELRALDPKRRIRQAALKRIRFELDPEARLKHNEKQRIRRSLNRDRAKLIDTAHAARRRSRKRQTDKPFTKDDIANLLRLQKAKCAYCKISIKQSYSIDHIVALSKGGDNSRRNIQLLCLPCNIKKHAKDPIEWANQLGLLV